MRLLRGSLERSAHLSAVRNHTDGAMCEFVRDMRIAKRSPATITARVELLERLRRYLADRTPPLGLLEADTDVLRDFQATYAHLAPASVDIYTRHMKSFYRWAHSERGMLDTDPAARLAQPRVPRGRPRPLNATDLQILFAATRGPLRVVFALAVFAGLRRGEICALQRHDLDLDGPTATALINGKGGRQRIVPILRPVLDELYTAGLPRAGYVVLDERGRPWQPPKLSIACHHHLRGLGLDATLHSGRHTFATHAARITKDPMFVRDMLGHASVATSEIYMASDLSDAHVKLAQMSTLAEGLLGHGSPQGLRVVGDGLS
jgi:integrase